MIKKEAEKILIYKDLIIEIQRMWNVKVRVIPVLRGAIGTISDSFRRYLRNIPEKYEIKGPQIHSHTGHCTHNAESVNIEVRNIFHGRNNSTCSTNCKYRTAATIYTVKKMISFRYIIVNTLHKGDNKDDDDDDDDDNNNNNNNNNNNHNNNVGIQS